MTDEPIQTRQHCPREVRPLDFARKSIPCKLPCVLLDKPKREHLPKPEQRESLAGLTQGQRQHQGTHVHHTSRTDKRTNTTTNAHTHRSTWNRKPGKKDRHDKTKERLAPEGP